MTTNLFNNFQDTTLPPARELRRPSAMFKKNLDEWKRLRGNDLRDKPDGAYEYFIADLKTKMATTTKEYLRAEETRAEVRDGADPRNFLIDAKNAPPVRYLEMTATWLGWRLVPLVRKYAKEFGQPEFATQLKKEVLAWLAKADAVWEALETMPEDAKTRESFTLWLEPLRADAERLCDAVFLWIDSNS